MSGFRHSKLLEKIYLSHLSIDCVIFGYHEKQLKILCVRISGMSGWLLPAGLIKKTEDMDDAASRILEERTGVKDLYLNQFRAFGKPGRSWKSQEKMAELKKLTGAGLKQLKWITEIAGIVRNNFIIINGIDFISYR